MHLAYEAGSVLDVYSLYKNTRNKKVLIDHMREELGDVLWFLSNLAHIFDLSLHEIALKNAPRSIEIYQGYHPRKKKPSFAASKSDSMSYYEKFVQDTDARRDISVSVLGLFGEIGSISTITKKIWRDSKGRPTKWDIKKKRNDIASEIGDCLWYLTSTAQNLAPPLSLSEIAKANLILTQDRWKRKGRPIDDRRYSTEERFPRRLSIKFLQRGGVTLMRCGSINIGDRLTDNARNDDGYRYHDAFHLAYMAVMGWSPVMRALLKCKRKTDKKIDEVEDGARAAIIEEAVAITIYNDARAHDFFRGKKRVDMKILDAARNMTQELEVNKCTAALWEKAILEGFKIFRALKNNGGGRVVLDLDKQTIRYFSI